MTARFIVGDVRPVLAAMPGGSVDLVLTSPPFLALRSYLPGDHPDKHLEIGSEATPGEFIDTLLDVVEACERVLAPHGSMCIELGDTYAGSGGSGGDYGEGGMREGQAKWSGTSRAAGEVAARMPWKGERDGWPLDKSLCLVPEIFRFALVYGFNPLTGRQTPRWRARNVIRWVRPNPPVGALGDKFRPGTSEMVLICKSRRRYFDLDAVRTPVSDNSHGGGTWTTQGGSDACAGELPKTLANPAGAPPLDWWKISTQAYEGAHYATFPEQLCVIPVKAMCPQQVCTVCGEPSRRIVETDPSPYQGPEALAARNGERLGMGPTGARHIGERSAITIGWTCCGHCTDSRYSDQPTGPHNTHETHCGPIDHWRTGIVLDPFAGSGTTLAVATGHGRDAIGIDLDGRNADLALERVGPLLLTVEHHNQEAA